MKKVLIFSTAYFPFVGGAEVAMKEITDRIDGYEFHMVTALMDKKIARVERVGNVLVHRIGIGIPMVDKLYLALWGYRKGMSLHKMEKYSCIWSLMASYNGFAARKMKKKTGLPFLLTLQEGDPIEYILHKVRFVKKQFREIFSLADALQPISNYLKKWGEDMGFNGKLSEVIPNGVDVERFTKKYPDTEIKELRKSFGFPDDSVVLVTASRLVVKNDVESVILALAVLPEEVCFVVCGTGELMDHLKNIARELGVEKRVLFAGNKSHEELPKILHASDIFIRPSITEGLGNSFLEAMAVGLPTIGTPVGGIPDFLEDGKTGFLCEVQNPESIANTVERIRELSDERKKEIHANAMKVIEGKYNWE
ncbi:MAG: glycosyltransferase family 4 protein, partial [Candidatus Magasanikbacteria bacterium]